MTDTCRFDHLALNANDPAAAAAWYARHFGGALIDDDAAGGDDRVVAARFQAGSGAAELRWRDAEAPGPSIGTGLDHSGWSVENLDEVHAAMIEDGATEFWQPRHFGPARLYISFVTDPWGAKIELLEDANHPGFHHVHILGPDWEKDRAWLLERAPGKAETFKDVLLAVNYGTMRVLFRETDDELQATAGRAIDHLAWSSPVGGGGRYASPTGVSIRVDPA